MRTPGRRRRPTPIRGARPIRRGSRVRRASGGWTPTRAGAALALLGSLVSIYGLTSSPAFDLERIDLVGDRHAPIDDLYAALQQADGANAFALQATAIETDLERLPAVVGAAVSVVLPDTLVVRIAEREPILVWRTLRGRFLVDREGWLFASLPQDAVPGPDPLPVVVDRRNRAGDLAIGRTIRPIDLDAATRLASLRPTDVGSRAARFSVAVTDTEGFLLEARPDGWTAVFGFYTPTLRQTEMIPGQVRLLRSLLGDRESEIERVILAAENDGTYIPRATSEPEPEPESSP